MSVTTKSNPKQQQPTSKKPATAPAKPKPPNKSAFIRSFPVGTPAKEIVEKAAKQGMDISVAHVYSARRPAGGSSKLPHDTATAVRLMANKVEGRHKSIATWVEDEGGNVKAAHAALEEAETLLRSAAEHLGGLPETYHHKAPKAVGPAALEVGAHVTVREKFREDYKDIITPEELADLVVVAATAGAGKRVRVRAAKGGDTLVVPRRELQLTTAA